MYKVKLCCVCWFHLARCVVKDSTLLLLFTSHFQKKIKSGPWDNTIGKAVSVNKQEWKTTDNKIRLNVNNGSKYNSLTKATRECARTTNINSSNLFAKASDEFQVYLKSCRAIIFFNRLFVNFEYDLAQLIEMISITRLGFVNTLRTTLCINLTLQFETADIEG